MTLVFLTTTLAGEGGIPRSARLVSSAFASRTVELAPIEKAGPVGRLLAGARAWATLRGLTSKDATLFLWHIHLLPLLTFTGWRGPVVVYLHGIEAWRPLRRSIAALLPRVSAFLHNSDHTWRTFVQYNPAAGGVPHRRVWLGLDTPSIETRAPGAPPQGAIVARVEASEGYKGHRELIEAWPLVLEAVSSARLRVVGGGSGIEALRLLASKLDLNDHIVFEGLCSEERKADLVRESRALLMPSRGEGFGLAYLEAMRMARPCLVSDCDAGREVVDPPVAGLAVDPADREALASAVVRLLSDGEEWRRWSVNAKARYDLNFTEAAFLERLRGALTGLGAL